MLFSSPNSSQFSIYQSLVFFCSSCRCHGREFLTFSPMVSLFQNHHDNPQIIQAVSLMISSLVSPFWEGSTVCVFVFAFLLALWICVFPRQCFMYLILLPKLNISMLIICAKQPKMKCMLKGTQLNSLSKMLSGSRHYGTSLQSQDT